MRKLLYSLLFIYSSLFSYTVEQIRDTTLNSRSDYYNGSCSYVTSDYVRGVYEAYYPSEFTATVSSSSVASASTFSNYALIQSLFDNPDFIFVSAISVTNNTYTHCETNGAESPTGSLYAKGTYDYKFVSNWQFVGTCELPNVYDDNLGTCALPPECSDSEYYDSATNTCLPIPDCPDGQYFEPDLSSCSTIPTCPDGYYFSLTSLTCEPIPTGANDDHDGDNLPNKCDKDFALSYPDLYNSYDCNEDDEPNGEDIDDDGDGLLDTEDPDNASYSDSTSVECGGADLLNVEFYPSSVYSIDKMTYYGVITPTACTDKLLLVNIDNVAVASDKIVGCEKQYCFIHDNSPTCDYDVLNYLPAGDWDYFTDLTESQCDSKVDGVVYSTNIYNVPDSLNCPNTAFCFLELIIPDLPDTNTENNDTTMDEVDLNSTSLDLAPLLQAQNTTNKHLQDLKDKTDITNNNLDDLKDTAKNTLINNQDMKSSLDKLTLDSTTSLKNQLDTNTKLDDIESTLGNSNSLLNDIKGIEVSSNTKLTGINDNLVNGLFGDDPFANVDLTDDGSSTFGELETTLTDNLSGTYQTNLFGLSSITGGGVSPITFSIQGSTYTLLSSETISQLPVDSIRAVFLLIAAIGGFITIFWTV